jgi:NADPH-dependent glutamate synthase beta subunit-like oxidoreductase
MTKKSIAIIGGGPSALMLATQINTLLYDVTIYEKNLSI